MTRMRTQIRAVTSSWRNQTLAVRVIRLWLGVTWIYGGWDKATDPGFLGKTSSTSISKQLTGYSTSSPLGFLFRHMIERSTAIGIMVMVLEFAIGIATLLWIAPTTTAFVGFMMSVGLWIAVTWHVKPYFLGSDTAYAVLWLAYFLTLVGKRRKIDISLDRRGAIRLAGVGIASIAAMFLGRGLAKTVAPTSTTTGAKSAKQLIKLADFPVGNNYEFATADGQPAIVFRTKNGVFAYSQICTHQGCTVPYSTADKALICPCHGATFDPFNGAKVLAGPANTPLSSIKVAISGAWVVLV
ncbi:MAG: DoxX family membrane protein [Streptomycetaceae bacterium]|nr:MAG: DoxX family membrane protein [Streptomycetaceae bacterium]